jgi:hypothetical protein
MSAAQQCRITSKSNDCKQQIYIIYQVLTLKLSRRQAAASQQELKSSASHSTQINKPQTTVHNYIDSIVLHYSNSRHPAHSLAEAGGQQHACQRPYTKTPSGQSTGASAVLQPSSDLN